MYIISVELMRFSALMVHDFSISRSPTFITIMGFVLYLSDLTHLFLCDANFLQIYRVHLISEATALPHSEAVAIRNVD
jgi:hypothetical protein